MLSAHVEFSRQSLKPTFKVISGRPGSSEAINIFQSICERQNFDYRQILNYLAADEIQSTERNIRQLEQMSQQQETKLNEIEQLKKTLKAEEQRLKIYKEQEIAKEIETFKAWLNQEREYFQNEVKLKKSKIAIDELTLKTKNKIDSSH